MSDEGVFGVAVFAVGKASIWITVDRLEDQLGRAEASSAARPKKRQELASAIRCISRRMHTR
jgi:hypothetical protein